jgi:hypothetical protein
MFNKDEKPSECEYCTFTGIVGEIGYHADMCIFDPKNQSCGTCIYDLFYLIDRTNIHKYCSKPPNGRFSSKLNITETVKRFPIINCPSYCGIILKKPIVE